MGKKAICPITQVRLRPGKNKYGIPYAIKLPCGHRFIRTALFKWVRLANEKNKRAQCPMCRRDVYISDLLTKKT